MPPSERRWLPVSAGGVIPDEFLCPISGEVMHDPVWLDTGITVDRAFAAYYMQARLPGHTIEGSPDVHSRLRVILS